MKGFSYGDWFFIGIIVAVALLTFIGLYEHFQVCTEDPTNDRCLSVEEECAKDCREFGMDFLHYNYGGLGGGSCWCINNNKSERIW